MSIKRICTICERSEVPADTITITRATWDGVALRIEMCLRCLKELETALNVISDNHSIPSKHFGFKKYYSLIGPYEEGNIK